MLVSSWNVVLNETIVNRFRKAGVISNQELAQTDGDGPFKELNIKISRLKEINSTEYQMSSDEFLRLDDNICATEEHPITVKEIKKMMVKMITTLWEKGCATKSASNREIRGGN